MNRGTRWDTEKGRELWDSGMKLREMGEYFAVHRGTISNFAKDNGWPPRKKYTRSKSAHIVRKEPTEKSVMRRRCPRCLAAYKAPLENAKPHELVA